MRDDPPPAGGAITVIILTYNSAASIARTIRSAQQVGADIRIVDSFSTDDTVAICQALGCAVEQRAFSTYADQRNWAIDHLACAPWQFHLDADEEVTPALAAAIRGIDLAATHHSGFIMRRRLVFLGRLLQHGGIARTWHCRLFRSGAGRCEDRLYDQHFVCSGAVGRIAADMLDHQEQPLTEWTARHNRWSDLEVAELAREAAPRRRGRVMPDLRGTPIERMRYMKGRYYRLPLFWRAVGYFLYRYVLRLGFLDGREGLIYHTLQALWFRFLIDAKLYERRSGERHAP